jgi:cytochrome P450
VMHSAANLSVGSLLVGALLERLPLPGVIRRRAAQASIATALRRCLAASDSNEAAQGMLPPLIEAYRHASQDAVPIDTEQEIIVQATALLFAGADTVSAGLCWTWAMLAQHPAIAAQFYHEVDQVLAGRAPTVDDLPHLPFTSAIVREVLRLYPPVWLISRNAIVDCQIGNFTIFRGTGVLISPWAVHRNPRLYERPLAFEPQRWLHDPRAHTATLAYMPFGAGQHTCMGQHLGMAELLLMLVLIAQRWRVELDPATVRPQAALTLRPLFPVPMRVYTR